MKTFGFVLALMVLVVGASFAATASLTIYPGWSTISLPIVPFEPKPAGPDTGSGYAGVLAGLRWDDTDNVLSRWNNTGSPAGWNTYSYDYDIGVDPNFGGMLLGEGYMIFNNPSNGTKTITITGVPSGVPDANGKTDMWLSLPKAGFHIVGVPYDQDINIDQDTGVPMSFTDGTTLKDWPTAAQSLPGSPQWVAETALRYNGARWVAAGINYYEEELWKKGCGYWFETKVDNLAMIIDAPL